MDPEGKGVAFVDPLSLGQAPPLIGLLDDLGIPWIVFADGDQGGRDALRAISRRLRRSTTSILDRVVKLPDGEDLEKYLVGEGLQPAIKRGIADLYGEGALTEFRSSSQKDALDDDELLIDFLCHKKGTYGAAVAAAIVSTRNEKGEPLIPERIAELLKRADRILGVG